MRCCTLEVPAPTRTPLTGTIYPFQMAMALQHKYLNDKRKQRDRVIQKKPPLPAAAIMAISDSILKSLSINSLQKKAILSSRMVGRSTDGALLNLMVSHEQLNRPLKWDLDLEAKIQALTADQVNAAFRKHLDPKGVSIVKAGDFKSAGVYK